MVESNEKQAAKKRTFFGQIRKEFIALLLMYYNLFIYLFICAVIYLIINRKKYI